MPAYASFDDWFQEMEGYGLRAERYYEDCENGAESKVMTEWLRTAWELGAAAERESCIKAIKSIPWSAPTAEGEWALREAAKVIANQIRSRRGQS